MKAFVEIKALIESIATERSLLVFLLAVSCGLNLLFVKAAFSTRAQIDLLLANRKLTLGENVRVLTASDASGHEWSIDLSSSEIPTVLYFRSENCCWSKKNENNVQELAAQSSSKYRFLQLSMEPFQEGSDSDVSKFQPDFFEPTVETKLAFDLYSTPTTFLITQNGQILKIWKGAYDDELKAEIEATLGVHLPGLDKSMSRKTERSSFLRN